MLILSCLIYKTKKVTALYPNLLIYDCLILLCFLLNSIMKIKQVNLAVMGLFFMAFSVYAESDHNHNQLNNERPYLTLEELKGAWRLVSEVKIFEKPKPEVKRDSTGAIIIESNRDITILEPTRDDYFLPRSVPIESLVPSDLIYVFKDDFFYKMSYPCRLYLSGQFELKKDSLKIHYSNDTIMWNYKLSYLNDTLTITGDAEYGIKKFVRADVDATVVEIITTDNINPLCLEGRWVDYIVDSDGSMKPLELGVDIPFDIPYVLDIKKENISKSRRAKKMTFIIDDKQWDFNYLLRADHILQLELLNWKTKDNTPLFLYYQKER
jgi:hypothetical protein